MHCAPLPAGKSQQAKSAPSLEAPSSPESQPHPEAPPSHEARPRPEAPPNHEDSGTLLGWYAERFPPVLGLRGRAAGEGGLLHRLDFETRGLVLFAKTQPALDLLLAQQAEGFFAKDYSAICQTAAPELPGFPPAPELPSLRAAEPEPPSLSAPGWQSLLGEAFAIESYFRPFGPGRKQVRPVAGGAGGKPRGETARDRGGRYRTEILGVWAQGIGEGGRGQDGLRRVLRLALRLRRGFRHQARCHLAWAGWPILNDPLYGSCGAQSCGANVCAEQDRESAAGFLALSADGLAFDDPESGERRKYRVPPLELRAISM